jgi:diguanylate cyclase (GGDEF)-like protein/PAS domain S-box-containing protein
MDGELAEPVRREGHRPAAAPRAHAAAPAGLSGLVETTSWYRQVVDQTHEGVWAVDMAGRTLFANRRIAEMLRCSPEAMAGSSIWDFVDRDAAASVRSNFERRRDGEIDQHERIYRRSDGSRMVGLVSAGPLTDASGVHVGSFAMISDITDRTEAQEALAERDERLRAFFEHAAVGQLLISADGRVLHANRAAERMTGYGPGELVGRMPLQRGRHEDVVRAVRLGRAILTGERDDGDVEVRYALPDGRVLRLLASLGVVRDGGGQAAYLTAVVQDVTQRRRAEEHLASLAHYDPVTGLANRTQLAQRLERALSDTDGSVAVLFIDLDGFKAINDAMGHATGNQLLAAVAERIRNATRPGDTAARFGGDEFIVVAPLDQPADAVALADRLLATVRLPFEADGVALSVNMSIGLSVRAVGTSSAAAILHEADLAMYQAKGAGGGHWVGYDELCDDGVVP